MLSILGIGAAVPENEIDNKLLEELGLASSAPALLTQSGIVARRTTLPLDYIRTTKNRDISRAAQIALESPTDLALRATELALERAGITPDQLGLIIGDCSTPVETTPSEAQRLGCRLDLQIPAYDLSAGFSGPAGAALEALSSFRPEQIPDYVLIVSSNTPTQKIDYSQGIEGLFFGDGAVAMVVSARVNGLVKLGRCSFMYNDRPEQISVGTLNRATIHQPLGFNEVGVVAARIARQSMDDGASLACCAIVGPQLSAGLASDLCRELSIPDALQWTDVAKHGYSLGAAELGVVARRWDELVSGGKSVLMVAAIGPIIGCTVFESKSDS